MINREKTNLYFSHFNYLTEALCLSWHHSFDETNKLMNEENLKREIRSYGFYSFHKSPRKDLPIEFRHKLSFKNLTWVSQYTDKIADDRLCDPAEPYQLALAEIEYNLFLLKNKDERIAYANLLLKDLDKTHIYNQNLDECERSFRYQKIFCYVLDHHFISEDNITTCNSNIKIFPIYKLSVLLINHLDFTDKLIEIFKCFEINLINLNRKSHCVLYIFDEKQNSGSFMNGNTTDLTSKFQSALSDECLIQIMLYLKSENWLINPDNDNWLYWFNRKPASDKKYLVWKGTPTMLSNIIQHICYRCTASTIKLTFNTLDYVKPTRSDYKKGTAYKKIEQLIILYNKKNYKNSDPTPTHLNN